MKIVKSPEDSSLFIKDISETIGNEKKKKWCISQYSIRHIGASSLGNPLIGKEIKTKIPSWGV